MLRNSRRIFALALVVSFSSIVAMKLGHIRPPITTDFLQSPEPLQFQLLLSLRRSGKNHSMYRAVVWGTGDISKKGIHRYGICNLPRVLSIVSGSQHFFISLSNWKFFSPIMTGMNSPLSLPSPCSPLIEPRYFFTSFAVSSPIFLKSSTSSLSLRFSIGLDVAHLFRCGHGKHTPCQRRSSFFQNPPYSEAVVLLQRRCLRSAKQAWNHQPYSTKHQGRLF